MHRGLWLALATALALALPASSSAAPVSVLGQGSKPRVVVDEAGNGHFTWVYIAGNTNVFGYCRVARGGGSCNDSSTFDNGEQNLAGGYAFLPGGNRVLLLESRCCTVYSRKLLYTSQNLGDTFDGGVSPGFSNDNGAGIAGQAVYAPPNTVGTPAEQILTINDLQTIGLSYQATGTTANPAFNGGFLMANGNAYDGNIARAGSNVVAVWSTLTPNQVLWRRWDGSGDVNVETNWTAPQLVGPTNIDSNVSLTGGPSGIWIAYNTGAPGAETFVVRQFTGNGFGPAIPVSETGDPDFGNLFEDPSGRLHFAWEDTDGNLRYRSTGSSGFRASQILSGPRADGNLAGLRVAANSAGDGFVTWNFYSSSSGVKSVPISQAIPPPELGKSVNVEVVSGKVNVSLPAGAARAALAVPGIKGRTFVPLTEARQIPVGSLLDTRKGTVRLTSASTTAGKTLTGKFSGGVFGVLQSRKRSQKGLTELRLKGASFRRCGKSRKSAFAARSKRRIRRLRGNGRGRFRTRGRYSAATVRGTIWTVTDRCDGTLTQVKEGTVLVRDFKKRKNVIVRAGKQYLARKK